MKNEFRSTIELHSYTCDPPPIGVPSFGCWCRPKAKFCLSHLGFTIGFFTNMNETIKPSVHWSYHVISCYIMLYHIAKWKMCRFMQKSIVRVWQAEQVAERHPNVKLYTGPRTSPWFSRWPQVFSVRVLMGIGLSFRDWDQKHLVDDWGW